MTKILTMRPYAKGPVTQPTWPITPTCPDWELLLRWILQIALMIIIFLTRKHHERV